ncbi:MAG TPA: class I mannose-6-phosphate isomerase [Candidatus Sulfotelmatobacter sp.]|nr:class I mannose-6-phosphate isomerase [Candidatus Sulfotelmatobacter sp.]
MTLCPTRFDAVFKLRPWGLHSLAPFFPGQTNLAEAVGEAWMTGSECTLANGPFAGAALGDAWPRMPAEWSGTKADHDAPFPILVKFIFTSQMLSVQVHPPDDYAAAREKAAGGRGKTEMWYAMDAQPGAQVFVGLRPGATREKFQRAIADGTADACLEKIPLHRGEAIFVPAGTVHTIGPGLALCEIQEHSDLTYRVFDYNRRDAQGKPRELHVQKALDVIQFGEQGGGKIEPVRIERGAVSETYFVACRYFATEKWEFSERVAAASSREHFDLLIFLEGAGNIEWGKERLGFAPMQVWMIPAALGAYRLAPDSRTALLRTYVPEHLDKFVERLTERGIGEEEWSRLVYP